MALLVGQLILHGIEAPVLNHPAQLGDVGAAMDHHELLRKRRRLDPVQVSRQEVSQALILEHQVRKLDVVSLLSLFVF